MSTHRLAKTRFGVGLVSLTAITAILWLVLWASIVPVLRGWSPVAVLTGSMAPRIDAGDIVVVAPYEGQALDPGTVIVFDNPSGSGTITHRIVDTTPTGDYVTRGDANIRIDSTPVSPDAIRGTGRILVPIIGAPFVWANQGRTVVLLIAAAITLAGLWASRWVLLTRYNPWRNELPPPAHASIAMIGALIGIWPSTSVPAASTPSQLQDPAQPSATGPTRTGSSRRLAVVAATAAIVVSAALVTPTIIRSEAAFTNAPESTGNSILADFLDSPTGLTATDGATINLSWTATADTYADGHRIYRSSTPGGPYVQVAEVTPRTTITYDDNPSPGTYYYVARAFTTNWESADSNEDSATDTAAEDFDAVPPASDNCPSMYNPDQFDTDGDGIGDACDPSPTVPSSATFTDSGQSIATTRATGLAVGDLDGDGDLDITYATDGANEIWTNDGTGTFTDSGQNLGTITSHGAAVGDFDGDGDLDITYANVGANEVWTNDGTGTFTDTGQTLGGATSESVAVGDFDGDGDLDITYANDGQPNTVWFNNGSGSFTDTGQTLGSAPSAGVAIGDLDGDGDLDIAYANDGAGDTVWLNDGTGSFTNTGQSLGIGRSRNVALHDLDGDGDLDIAYAGDNDGDTVWLNDGTGSFTDTGQVLGLGHSRGISIGDLDGDGDPDIIYGSHTGANSVWLNDGTATFSDSGQTLGNESTEEVALGDLDGDGDLDAITADDGDPNTVWINS